jgi:hypothetical protein
VTDISALFAWMIEQECLNSLTVRDAGGDEVCELVTDAADVTPEMWGRARLIVASPKMRDLLQRIADVPPWDDTAAMQRAIAVYTLLAQDARDTLAALAGKSQTATNQTGSRDARRPREP